MANLTESPIYEPGIFQLEKSTPAQGGAPVIDSGVPSAGHANAQALQLANRTAYLKQQLDAGGSAASLASNLSNNSDNTKGAALIGYNGTTVAATLDSVRASLPVFFSTYAALRSYSGSVPLVRITDNKLRGDFYNLGVVGGAVDDGGVTIVSTNGTVWQRYHSGDIDPMWYGAVGDGTTDDSVAVLAACTYANTLASTQKGANVVFNAPYTFGMSQLARNTTNVSLIGKGGWIKCLGNPAAGTDILFLPINGASNFKYSGLKFDLNNIPAVNGFVARTGNANSVYENIEIINAAHDKTTTSPAHTGTQGGRGFILESLTTSLNNRNIQIRNISVRNCYMGFAVQGGEGNNRNNFIIDNISIDSCDVAYWTVGNTTGYPHDADEMQGIISNVTWRNCGKNTQYTGQDGAIVADRCSNIVMKNIAGHNSTTYGSPDCVVRGNFSKTVLDLVYIGDAANAISFSPYKESDTVVAFENSVQDCDFNVIVHGTVGDFIKNTTTTTDYVVRTNISGSATTITTKRAVTANFVGFSTLRVDILERATGSNSRIIGPADAVAATLFTAFPNRKIDLDISRVGALTSSGDITVSSFTPRVKLTDLSASSKDYYVQGDANTFSVLTDTTVDSGLADRKVMEINDATGVGVFYASGTASIGFDTAGLRAGVYTNTVSTITGYITIKDLAGTTRRIAVVA